MHTLEPYYNWRSLYTAEEDDRSPFYEREYSEFEFTHHLYNFLLHPQWDDFGSETLYLKILFVDYNEGFAIMELLGEWNDAVNNDIMFLKREVADVLMAAGINKFMLLGENVLNFHVSDDSYYEEWFEDVEEGWIALLNFREHVLKEIQKANLDYYMVMGGEINLVGWRTLQPLQLYQLVQSLVTKRIG
jgi:hypothetical protein